MPDDTDPRRTVSGPLRVPLLVLGALCTGLGALGAVLPLLPATPFLLLAAACFVRSSPAAHRRLLANRMFGAYLAQWQHDRSVPRDAKLKAYALVTVTFAVSIAVADAAWQRAVLAALGLALLGLIAWLRTTQDDARVPASGDADREPAG